MMMVVFLLGWRWPIGNDSAGDADGDGDGEDVICKTQTFK